MKTHRILMTSFLSAVISAILLIISSSCSQQPGYPAPVRAGADVAIDVISLKPEIPVFYTYRYENRLISFFVLKSGDKILSFLDACATCYIHKRGYEYKDNVVTCRYCGTQYPISKLEKGLGGCYPIRIEGRMEHGKYLIPVSTLEATVNKF
jgi:uncharacterized membrane protein